MLMTLAKLAVGLPILAYPVSLSFAYRTQTTLRRVTSRLGTGTSWIMQATIFRLTSRIRPRLTRPHVPDFINAEGEKTGSGTNAPSLPPHSLGGCQKSIAGQFRASVPAAVFMGVAMVSRGEIGLLIAQLARGNGSGGEERLLGGEAFSVCIWAILVCTLIGPIGTGIVVGRWGSKVTVALWA